MDSIAWFWFVGRHDPTWVQAVSSVALVVLTTITLIVLGLYARDTHTLAKTSAEQIAIARKEHEALAMRNYHIAYTSFLQVQRNLYSARQASVRNFLRHPRTFCPSNWADVTSAFFARTPSTAKPAIDLGVELSELDFVLEEFYRANLAGESAVAELKVADAIREASEKCEDLHRAIQAAAQD